MTVPDQTPQNVHTANGATTTFAYQFKILDTDHLEVYLDDVLQTSGYSVTGEGVNAGGTVVFTTAPAADTEVILMRSMTIERTAYDYQNAGDFLAATVNEDFDAAIMIAQQINNTLTQRALLFPATLDRTNNTNALPEPQEGRVLYWDEDGEIQNALISSLATNPTFASELRTFDTMAQAIADATLEETNVLFVAGRDNSFWDLSASGTANTYDVVYLTASGLYANLRLHNGNTSFRALGAAGDGVTNTNSLISRANTLLSDGATLFGHPDDDYFISTNHTISKAITIDMRGGTVSASGTNSSFTFTANGRLLNATMDAVWAGWSGTGVTHGYCNNCDFINQIYTPTTAVQGAMNVIIDHCRFIGQPSGGNFVSFQVTTGSDSCKFINNYCEDVKGGCNVNNSNHFVMSGNRLVGVLYNGIKAYVTDEVIVENNHFEDVVEYSIFYDSDSDDATGANQLIVQNNEFVNCLNCLYNVAATNPYLRVVFQNNWMRECSYGVQRSVGHTIVVGNHFYNGGALYYYGGGSLSSWDLTIENNVIVNSGNLTSLTLGNDTDSTPIMGCVVYGALTSSTYKSSINIRNNTFSNYHTYGIMGASLGGQYPLITITDNKFDAGANSTYHMLLGASDSVIIKHNKEITAPSSGVEVFFPRIDRHPGFVQYRDNDWQFSSASPTTKTWLLGTIHNHSAPASGGNIGWVNVFSFSTTLTATEPNTETSMAVTSGTGTANGDIIGVMLDSGSIHWTTISSGGGTTTIVLTSGITGQATSGNRVYVFRWKSFGTIA